MKRQWGSRRDTRRPTIADASMRSKNDSLRGASKRQSPPSVLQNVRLVKVTLPLQEENLGQTRF